MANPKYRMSKSKRNMRRSHHALEKPGMSICPESNEVRHPHCMGPTGYYKGRIIDKKLAKKAAPAGLSNDDFKME